MNDDDDDDDDNNNNNNGYEKYTYNIHNIIKYRRFATVTIDSEAIYDMHNFELSW